MARASTPTLLSLDRFAAILGVNPAHFNQAANSTVMPYGSCCQDIHFQYDWQFKDRVSRESLAYAIAQAERDIAEALGYWPAPTWMVEEVRQYPQHYQPDVVQYGMLDARGYAKALKTEHGQVIAPGRRAVTLIGTVITTGAAPGLVYSDADGDGVIDTATITVATTLTDVREIKVYFAGHAGLPEWEIRTPRSKAITGGNFIATFWPWQLIDPDLWDALATTADATAIDWNVSHLAGAPPAAVYDNLVTSVDVYHEYNDTTAVSAVLYWEPSGGASVFGGACCSACGGAGCVACTLTTQDGCLHVRDAEVGLVVPQPAAYDSTDAAWEASTPAVCRDPDYVKLWYYSGLIDGRYLNSQFPHDPLPQTWAEAITYLTMARLNRPLCSCDRVEDMFKDLQTDLALVGGPTGYNVDLAVLGNPFGTRKGAVLAWQRVMKLAKRIGKVAVI